MKYNKIKYKSLMTMALVMCMMLTLVPVPVLATENSQIEDATENSQIEIPEDAIYIETEEELLELAENCRVNTWSVGKTVVLSNDIDMSQTEFKGIPTFGGIFLGQGYTVKGVNLVEEGSIVGFFRYIQKSAVVDKLTVDGTVMPTGSKNVVGGFVGQNAGIIRNCIFNGTVSGYQQIGGMVGVNETTGIVENCTVSGTVYGNHFVGGFVGENHGVIRESMNQAEINTQSVQNTVAIEDITIDSLINTESANTTTDVGGIAGGNSGVIRACINNGSVGYKNMGYNIGGIVGTQNGYVVNCVNNADIQGRKEIGGIVGHMEPNIVLDYDKDSLQLLSSQMNSLEYSIQNVENKIRSSGEDVSNQVNGLSDDMENLQNAINALSVSVDYGYGGVTVDTDLVTAAVNDMGASFGEIYKETQNIQDSADTTTEDITSELKNVLSQLERVSDTVNSMESNFNFNIEDISGNDTEDDTLGKVANCVNYGDITGDLNIGGIAGVLAEESDLDEYQDVTIYGDASLNATYQSRVVVRGCKNVGTIAANKMYAGGVVGQMVEGAVLECVNLGNLDGMNADYVGGIAGNSGAIIRDSNSKCIIAGDTYVGGIAGNADEVTDCYAFVDIAKYTEKAGAIAGSTDELPDGTDDVILRNYYYIAGENVGGIDGISYTGAADSVDLADFLTLTDLDEDLCTVNVCFVAEGQEDVVISVAVGESLPMNRIPELTPEDGSEYTWELLPAVTTETVAMGETADVEYISEEKLTGILFDQTYEASFNPKATVIKGADKNENGLAVVLAEGIFAKNVTLEMEDMISSEPIVNEQEVIVNWQVVLSDTGVTKLHYLIPEGVDSEAVLLFIKDTSGNWIEREFVVDGTYFVFDFSDGETAFAVVEDTSVATSQMMMGAAVVVLLCAGVVVVAKLRKRRK